MTFDTSEKVPLEYSDIQPELNNVLTSVSNKLEREWPKNVGTPDSVSIVTGLFRVAVTSFDAMRFIAAVKPPDPLRRPEFVIAAPPILRSILDAYANIVYLFDDLPTRTTAFLRRGWKEDFEKVDRYRKTFESDPWWSTRLSQMSSEIARIQKELNISDGEITQLRRWPALGAMISKEPKHPDRVQDPSRLQVLTYLNDWFYRELSEETHLTPPGLYRRAEILLVETRQWTADHAATADQLRSDVYMIAFALLLGMSSELQNELRFGMGERLVRLWVRLCHHSKMIEHVYDFRYRGLLAGQP